MPHIYYEESGIVIIHGDSRDALPILRGDAIVTDPPYNVRTDDIELEGRSPMKRDFGVWDTDWKVAPFLEEAAPVVAPGGTLLAFTSDRLLAGWRGNELLWRPRGTLVWEKTNPAPHPRPAYVSATEWIVWLQREGAPAVWNGTGYTLNILRYPVCAGGERFDHPTQKPLALMMELIARHTVVGSMVIDPFMGTGTTLVAAKRLGRKAVGIELDERYCEMAVSRLAQATFAFDVKDVLPVDNRPLTQPSLF